MESLGATSFEQFEAACAKLCADLRLGFPVHMASGADRGKDIATGTFGIGKSKIPVRIHVECKYSIHRSGIGIDVLYPKALWAIASHIDILIVITNSRFTASTYDWIDQSRPQVSHATVLWDGHFISWLATQLIHEGGLKEKAIEHVHSTLATEYEKHKRSRTSPTYDGYLQSHYRHITPSPGPFFVNRDREIGVLRRFSKYHYAALTGPPGIGKTALGNRILQEARRRKYKLVYQQLDNIEQDNPKPFVGAIARTLLHELDDADLWNQLAHFGIINVKDVLDLACLKLHTQKLFVLLDDAHVLQPGRQLSCAVDTLLSVRGRSKFLITSRHPTVSSCIGTVPDITCELDGFGKQDISSYLTKRGFREQRGLTTYLYERYRGWPIMMAMVCSEPAPKARTDMATNRDIGTFSTQEYALLYRMLQQLKPDATTLLFHISQLSVDLEFPDLSALLGMKQRVVDTSWEELWRRGFLRHRDKRHLTSSVHRLVRDYLTRSIDDIKEIWLRIGRFLSYFDEDAVRVLASIGYFIKADQQSEAASLILYSSDVLIRTGSGESLLQYLAALRPHDVSESEYLSLVLVRIRILEQFGDIVQADEILESSFYPQSVAALSPLLASIFRYHRARIDYFLGNYEHASKCLQDNLEIRQVHPESGQAREFVLTRALSLQLLARIQYTRRRLQESENLYREALRLHTQIDDQIGQNKVRHRLAMIKAATGQTQFAAREFEGVLRQARRLKDKKREAYALHRLAENMRMTGDFNAARKLHQDSLRIKKQLCHRRGFVFTTLAIARLEIAADNLGSAEEHIINALSLLQELNLPKEVATAYYLYGVVEERKGHSTHASNWFEKAMAVFSAIGLESRAELIRSRDHTKLDLLD